MKKRICVIGLAVCLIGLAGLITHEAMERPDRETVRRQMLSYHTLVKNGQFEEAFKYLAEGITNDLQMYKEYYLAAESSDPYFRELRMYKELKITRITVKRVAAVLTDLERDTRTGRERERKRTVRFSIAVVNYEVRTKNGKTVRLVDYWKKKQNRDWAWFTPYVEQLGTWE